MKVRAFSKPGIMGMVLGVEPVAMMTASNLPMVLTSVTSVLKWTSMPAFSISLLYQRMSSLSFSLKVMAEAVRNRPPSSLVFSKITGMLPC